MQVPRRLCETRALFPRTRLKRRHGGMTMAVESNDLCLQIQTNTMRSWRIRTTPRFAAHAHFPLLRWHTNNQRCVIDHPFNSPDAKPELSLGWCSGRSSAAKARSWVYGTRCPRVKKRWPQSGLGRHDQQVASEIWYRNNSVKVNKLHYFRLTISIIAVFRKFDRFEHSRR
jgi:hypothetical protein